MNDNSVGDFLGSISTSLLSIIISLVGFWTAFVRGLVNRRDVEKMIEAHNPYLQDRQFILERLDVNKSTLSHISDILQQNTEVMTELKVQIATLAQTLKHLEQRIER